MCGFCTSDDAALVLAGLYIEANEVRRVYNRRHGNKNTAIVKNEEPAVSMQMASTVAKQHKSKMYINAYPKYSPVA